MTNLWPWLVLLGLGALHGINPGMGWLFAVCLGLQERRRKAVLAALPPIALGPRPLGRAGGRAHCRAACPFECQRFAIRLRGTPRWIRSLSGRARSPSAMGRNARWISRSDSLVISHGFSAWRGSDVDPSFSGDNLTGFPRCDGSSRAAPAVMHHISHSSPAPDGWRPRS